MEAEKKMYEYEVKFQPTVDSRDQRFKLVRAQSEFLGPVRNFDGVCLSLPFLLKDLPTVLQGELPETNTPVQLTITLKHVKKLSDQKSIQFYNVLFRLVFLLFTVNSKLTLSLQEDHGQVEDGRDEQELLPAGQRCDGAATHAGDLARLRHRSPGVRRRPDAQPGRLAQGSQDPDGPRAGKL